MKIKSNHLYRPFQVNSEGVFVKFNGSFLEADQFLPITDIQKTENPALEKWDYIFWNTVVKVAYQDPNGKPLKIPVYKIGTIIYE